jgi:succinate dehydrogenase/fumarate reductase flavoprotein subunit
MRSTASARTGVRERYGNLFDIYHEITAESAYQVPMRIFPAVHYTMGGLWVDYNLMSNVPGSNTLMLFGRYSFVPYSFVTKMDKFGRLTVTSL